MRSYILLLSVVLFSLFSKNSYTQNAIIDVESNISISVEDVFNLIRSNTNYQFIYKYSLIKDAPNIRIDRGIIKVKDLLKKGLDGINCTYDFDDDQTIVVRKKKPSNKVTKIISGKITHLNDPLQDVNIFIRGKQKGTKTNKEGYYKIEAEVGDVVKYSHVSFTPLAIIIEDVTDILNIKMEDYTNKLDEVTVNANAKIEKTFNVEAHNVKYKTALGNINPMLLGGTRYFPSNRIQKQYRTLSDALKFYYPKGLPVSFFDVDGVLYTQEPLVELSTILHLYVYPGDSRSFNFPDPIMIIRTTNSPEYKEKIAEQHRNQNYYKDDAITNTQYKTKDLTSNSSYNKLRTVKGKITHLGAVLPDVNIKIKGRTRGTKTDRKGNYKVDARIGEIIQYSYVGFKSISIIVEDITKEINIDMITKINELDEVLVTVKTIEGNTLQRFKKADKAFNSSRGNFNPKTSGYSIGFIEGDEVSNLYGSIKEALVGKIAGYSVDGVSGKAYLRGKSISVTQDYPVAWEVDGVFTSDEPTGLDLSQIENVYALKSLAATNKYGTLGAGGVIVIITKLGNFNPNNQEKLKIANQYTNKNYYNNDAKQLNLEQSNNLYTDILESFNDVQEAYSYYNNDIKYVINDLHSELLIVQKFITHYNNRNLGVQILKDLAKKYRSHPELLKAIAYKMQIIGAKNQAVKVYQEIYKLRPKYAQSYRDLANAYHENDQYKKSWRLYMSYLLQGHDVTNEGIGSIIYNEMEYLYFNRQYQTKIKEKFIPKNETLEDFRNDVRMIFEWNTSEAEFDLEFVSPDKRSYVFEHSLTANEKLIIDEKTKGYSSKEFIIEAIGNGEWLVNINYNGNKKPEPTYFKLTTYYHWGKSNQRKEIQIFKFQKEREKIQLAKINKQSLLTSK